MLKRQVISVPLLSYSTKNSGANTPIMATAPAGVSKLIFIAAITKKAGATQDTDSLQLTADFRIAQHLLFEKDFEVGLLFPYKYGDMPFSNLDLSVESGDSITFNVTPADSDSEELKFILTYETE